FDKWGRSANSAILEIENSNIESTVKWANESATNLQAVRDGVKLLEEELVLKKFMLNESGLKEKYGAEWSQIVVYIKKSEDNYKEILNNLKVVEVAVDLGIQ